MRNLFFLIILVLVATFISCEKNADIALKSNAQPSTIIRSFANFEALETEVVKTCSFTLDDLIAYEETIHFNSFGKMADQNMLSVVKDIEIGVLKTEESASVSINNSQYLQIIPLENGEGSCETKCYLSPYRYVMNSDRMFKVDTLYFKVFEDGHVNCGASHYNLLINLSESDFSTLVDDDIFTVFKYSSGSKGSYGTQLIHRADSGNERVKVRIWYVQHSRRMVNGQVEVSGITAIRTRGYKKTLGIWWIVKRDITNNVSSYVNVGGSSYYCSDSGTTKNDYKREVTMRAITKTLPYGVSSPNEYIESANGTAKTQYVTATLNYN